VNVGEICNCDAATVCATASLAEAAESLSNSYADAIVVIASPVQRPTAIGVITYREIVNALAWSVDLKRTRVIDVLDRNPVVLHEEQTLEDAILKLRSRGAKHAHVTGQGGTLRGMVSMDRLLGCRYAAELGSRARATVADTTYK
jgi:predicted transcriptional regulator